jgi:hypothetical protein
VKVIDPGHQYELDNLDTPDEPCDRSRYCVQILTFVKRVGEKYPETKRRLTPGRHLRRCCGR